MTGCDLLLQQTITAINVQVVHRTSMETMQPAKENVIPAARSPKNKVDRRSFAGAEGKRFSAGLLQKSLYTTLK
jgi:hypothetical protein